MPPYFRVVDASIWENGLKSRMSFTVFARSSCRQTYEVLETSQVYGPAPDIDALTRCAINRAKGSMSTSMLALSSVAR